MTCTVDCRSCQTVDRFVADGNLTLRRPTTPNSTRLRAEDQSPLVENGNGAFRPPVTPVLSGSPVAHSPLPGAG